MTAPRAFLPRRSVAVIGAGFSGLLTAIHLLEADPRLQVRLVEKASQFGRGRAYGPDDPDHLLNVRVANMSAFPDRPSHFQDWLRHDSGGVDPGGFVSRRRYGDYLQGLLRGLMAGPAGAGRLLLEQDEAVVIRPVAKGHEVRLAMGRAFQVDAVVLAVGLGTPALPAGVSKDVLGYRTYVADPWATDLSRLPDGEILLIGSGLTMVDVATSLDRPARTFVALSRHGLLPRVHAAVTPAAPPTGALDTPLAALRTMRRHARQVGWRSAVDSIRPLVVATWQSWSLPHRRWFLRRLQPWWDVHRHRVSALAADRLAPAMWGERLAVLAGKLEALEPAAGGFRARIRLRGRRLAVARDLAAAVNCTGLSGDLSGSRLLNDLQDQGFARPDPLELGLDVDAACRVLGRDGRPVHGLYAAGPLTRGAFWEVVAVPDLRRQTAQLAASILSDLPVPSCAVGPG